MASYNFPNLGDEPFYEDELLGPNHTDPDDSIPVEAESVHQDATEEQELNDEKQKSIQLLADINVGRRRVQFANAALATCEQSARTVPGASRLGDGTTVQLSATAGRNILAIRDGVNQDRIQLIYLQAYIRALQTQGIIAH